MYVPRLGCHTKTRVTYLRELGLEYRVNVYNNCPCNELAALMNRHLLDKGTTVDEEWWGRVSGSTEKFYHTTLTLARHRDIIKRYSGAKKKKYIKAATKLKGTYSDKVSMFVKTERFKEEDIGVKPPRAIQFRSPSFNLAMLQFVTPFEEFYYPELTYGVVSKTRIIAKGLNWMERAELLVQKASYFRKPKFYMLDYSAFDSTIRACHLKSTHRKYYKCFGRGIRRICRSQLVNVCKTRSGIRYVVHGTRMSGDPDTGCGNTVINADALYGVLEESGIVYYDMLLDGDDAVVIVEEGEELDVSVFEKAGFIVKVSVTNNIHKVEFCQSRIVLTPQPLFVRNPVKVLSTTRVAVRCYPGNFASWQAAVGDAELAVNPGVPILQQLGYELGQLSTKRLFDRDLVRRMAGMVKHYKPVTLLARVTMQEAWGITIPMQLLVEAIVTAPSMSIYRTDSLLSRQNDEQLQRTWARIQCSPECGGSSWWSGG